ncbi:MAG: hypothetical protein ACR2NN_12440, partial [Bryobacteraceae bacterium]
MTNSRRIALAALLAAPLAFAQSYNGNVDSKACSSIVGWVWDANQPSTPISVDFWVGPDSNTRTTFVTSFIANQFAYYAGTSLLVNGTYGIWPMNCPAGSTGYQPYYADPLTSVNTTNWNQNGTVSTSSAGFTSAGAGSLISKVAAPQNTYYQVKMTLKLTASGGYYLAFLRGSPDAKADGTPTGTYYAVQLAQPTFSGGACSGTLQVYSVDGNGVTILTSATIPCHDGMTITGVMLNNLILV